MARIDGKQLRRHGRRRNLVRSVARGVQSGALGVPYPGEFHKWCGLDVVGVWGTDARIGPSEWDDLGLSVASLVGSVGVVVGGSWGGGSVASIVVRCVGLRACWCSCSADGASVGQEVMILGVTVALAVGGLQMASSESA